MKAVLSRVSLAVGLLTGARPVPLAFWLLLQRLARRADALVPAARPTRGADLPDPVLAAALSELTLGAWTLGPSSIAALRRVLTDVKPGVVVEFGSGVSTVCLAHYGADLDPLVQVISLEQDAAEVARTTALLARLPVSSPVTLLHAPLEERVVEGRRLSSYSLADTDLDSALGGRSIDLVVIDGPAAEDGARFGTLPLLLSRLSPKAVVFMDDALRDGELSAARGWVDLGTLKVDGIIPVGHGLLIGRMPPPHGR